VRILPTVVPGCSTSDAQAWPPLRPGRMLVGRIACSCGRHLTWCCECGAATYGPALAYGCGLLDGPIALLVDVDSAFTQSRRESARHRGDLADVRDSHGRRSI
jgi:hypothetical protein